jgi:hypothetical protein
MGIGVSVFLITLGAIFKFAITAHLSGVDLQAIGVILMVVGVAVLVLNIILMQRRPRSSSNDSFRDENTPPM